MSAPLPPATLARFDTTGPRYTSYPTADRFVEAFGVEQYAQALRSRSQGVGAAQRRPLALYVHLPFCASVCYYCACNKVVTRDRSRAEEYLDALEREVELHTRLLDTSGATVSQLHLGGGTPTFLDDHQLERLTTMLQSSFAIVPGAERAIEIDPRTVDAKRLQTLASLGFDRLSLGVQDFDPLVQKAVHRVQPFDDVAELMVAARHVGFESINVDLIHGLPQQTAESFARTLEQVRGLQPDRIALYAYAHLPERFKPQRRIDAAALPPAAEKSAMLRMAINAFLGHGYDYIGMDHFARPDDALAVAKRQGRLHRNFQGYTVQPDGDLIGLGVSAIGCIGACYAQNAKTLPEYYDALRHGRFATARGLALDRDDLLRRAVIMAIMCQGQVVYESIEAAHVVDFLAVFAGELDRLRSLQAHGLVKLERDGFEVTPAGWYAVRAVAMVFDKYLHADESRSRFSRIL